MLSGKRPAGKLNNSVHPLSHILYFELLKSKLILLFDNIVIYGSNIMYCKLLYYLKPTISQDLAKLWVAYEFPVDNRKILY